MNPKLNFCSECGRPFWSDRAEPTCGHCQETLVLQEKRRNWIYGFVFGIVLVLLAWMFGRAL